MKRKTLVVVLFCIMGLMIAGAAQATVYNCSIQQAGVVGSVYYVVYLTDLNAASPAWAGSFPFLIPTTSQSAANSMYAAALTALSTSSQIVADIYNPGTMPMYAVIFSLSAHQ